MKISLEELDAAHTAVHMVVDYFMELDVSVHAMQVMAALAISSATSMRVDSVHPTIEQVDETLVHIRELVLEISLLEPNKQSDA